MENVMSDSPSPKHFVVSWDQFHRDSKALALCLLEKNNDWKGIIAITRGGLVPAGIVARELEIKLVETIGISSYDDKIRNQVSIIKSINKEIVGSGKDWLIIDDLVDTGNTVNILRKMLPEAHIATVYAKPEGKPLVETYVTLVNQDTWIYFPWEVDIQPIEPIAADHKNDKKQP